MWETQGHKPTIWIFGNSVYKIRLLTVTNLSWRNSRFGRVAPAATIAGRLECVGCPCFTGWMNRKHVVAMVLP